MSDGFLGRWSRRKLDVREGKPLAPEPVATAAPVPQVASPPPPERQAAPAEPPPTLADAQALTPESDFTRFTRADVTPEVRNAAMKKLFADPHFNVMDRLDTYIDDYSQPDPIPPAMLRQLASAQFLKLFDDEKEAEGQPAGGPGEEAPHREVADAAGAQTVAQSGTDGEAVSPPPLTDADPDLRLQQDHAPGPPGPGQGTE